MKKYPRSIITHDVISYMNACRNNRTATVAYLCTMSMLALCLYMRDNALHACAYGVLMCILYAVTMYLIRCIKMVWAFHGFPEPTAGKHWLFGHMLMVTGKASGKARLDKGVSWSAKFKKLYVLRFGPGSLSVVIVHPDSMKAVLRNSDPKPTEFGRAYRHGIPWLGEGLIVSSGLRWWQSRRLITPSFHFEKLKPYVTVYRECGECLLANIDKYTDSGASFEITHFLGLCTLDILLKCAFSLQTDCQLQSEKVDEFVTAVQNLGKTWAQRNRSPWFYLDPVFYLSSIGRQFRKDCNYVHSVADKIIIDRIKARKTEIPTHKQHMDFLDILLSAKDENGVGLSRRQIRDEVNTFLFAGHDTTFSSISWILFSLAQHHHFQRECQEEIDRILNETESDKIKWKDLGKLQFLTQCIKEAMRLHSPVPIISRNNEKPINIDNLTIPAGTNIVLHIYQLHNNPTVWDSPSEFRPDRFSKENIANIEAYAYIPFAAGPRNCIGQNFAMNEIKVIVSMLLRRFTFSLDSSHKVEKSVSTVMKAVNGIKMFAERRTHD